MTTGLRRERRRSGNRKLGNVTEAVKITVANAYHAAIVTLGHGWADNVTVVVPKNRERSPHGAELAWTGLRKPYGT